MKVVLLKSIFSWVYFLPKKKCAAAAESDTLLRLLSLFSRYPRVSNFDEIYKFLNKQKISKKIINLNQTANVLQKLFNSKKSQKNIKDKINKIGQKILKKNIDEINLIINKV